MTGKSTPPGRRLKRPRPAAPRPSNRTRPRRMARPPSSAKTMAKSGGVALKMKEKGDNLDKEFERC